MEKDGCARYCSMPVPPSYKVNINNYMKITRDILRGPDRRSTQEFPVRGT